MFCFAIIAFCIPLILTTEMIKRMNPITTHAIITYHATVKLAMPLMIPNNGAPIAKPIAYAKPTIYTEGEGQVVNGAEAMFTNSEVREGQVQYYLLEENSRDNINVNLEQKLQAFKEKYYNKFRNKKITTSDAEFDSSLVYTNLGNVNSTVDTITVNDETIDSTVVGVSIGNNAFLRAPLFKVEDGVLYVSTVAKEASGDLGGRRLDGLCPEKATGKRIFALSYIERA